MKAALYLEIQKQLKETHKEHTTHGRPIIRRNMSQQEASNDYTQVSSFAQNDLDESTLTTDLETNRNTKPFKPVEQAYLKAFIKITRQRTKANHHHIVLNEALATE